MKENIKNGINYVLILIMAGSLLFLFMGLTNISYCIVLPPEGKSWDYALWCNVGEVAGFGILGFIAFGVYLYINYYKKSTRIK